jgi:hypothetical protein
LVRISYFIGTGELLNVDRGAKGLKINTIAFDDYLPLCTGQKETNLTMRIKGERYEINKEAFANSDMTIGDPKGR